MKSAVKGGAAANAPALSQIPLPRRKSSGKGEKILELHETDSELGGRSPAKMSLLGASSFCCTSGQKEDYLPEARFLPTPKKKPAKQEPGSPLVPPAKPLLRSRRKILESNSEDTLSQVSELGSRKLSNEDFKLRPPTDSKLRHPDPRGKTTPASPHRKLSRDPLPFQKEILEAKKAGELGKKVRNDSSPRIGTKESKKCKEDNATDKCHEIGSDHASKSPKVASKICIESSTLFHPVDDSMDSSKSNSVAMSKIISPVKVVPSERIYYGFSDLHSSMDKNTEKIVHDDANRLPLMLALNTSHECSDNHLDTTNCLASSPKGRQSNVDRVMMDKKPMMQDSHNSDDLDCPCCDKTPTAVDGSVTDLDLNVLTCWDVAPWRSGTTPAGSEDSRQKELALLAEVKALHEDLEAERLRLKTQEEQVHHLKEELIMMEHLKKELENEKELRKIVEDKLLNVLDLQKRMESEKQQNEKRTESKGTQMDDTDLVDLLESSPSVMGYESRVRRYQAYISKLEDNQALVTELKKFKDMSPLAQEAQGQLLLEKLSEIHRSSQRQQLQYESCLDEVANRLVQTVLVQKRLEEECKILHLRVEQLEQENEILMELMDDDKSKRVTKATPLVEHSTTHAKEEIDDPSHHASSLDKKSSISFEDKVNETPRSSNVKQYVPKNPVTSPVSPTAKPGSKIPAFGNTKTTLTHKKSRTEGQATKAKSEIHSISASRMRSPSSLHPNDPSSPTNTKYPSTKNKTVPSFENSKVTSVKRKRLSRNSSPAEKGAKDSKQRMKNTYVRWERRQTIPEDLDSLCELSKGETSPIQELNRQQQIWSFNCEVNGKTLFPESFRKIDDSIDTFQAKLDDSDKANLEFDKQNFSAEASTSIGGANRTRDEGYSTMSSDLQPDSAADTTVSEQEVPVTYTVTEKELRCVSDDSVTECLDGSMCSSSDSGFGPLHLIANSKTSDSKPSDPNPIERRSVKEPLIAAQEFFRNVSTVRHKDQIASVKPIIRSHPTSYNEEDKLYSKSRTLCNNFIHSKSGRISQHKTPTEDIKLSPLIARNILKKLDGEFQTSSPKKSKFDYISMLDYWKCDLLDIASRGKTWHLGSKKTDIGKELDFCSRQSYIEDSFFDEKVRTAEKATLTEPEEGMWREMALAPFIDESIWSLYSSEGDIRIVPLEPMLSEPSLDKLISECNPCIIITEDDSPLTSDLHKFVKVNVSNGSAGTDIANTSESRFKGGLERVASDTILYLKDAIHELEDSMHRCLKSSKNVSSLHNNSTSESEASPSHFRPEFLLHLDRHTSGQSHLVWPSPTRSSSASSVQSSASCHVISDETDDVDILQNSSRKGSQDLSSSSDVECENPEHQDFVERWLQNEIVSQNPVSPVMVPQLEPLKETMASVSIRRKSSLPYNRDVVLSRPRFMSYPQTTTSSLSKLRERTGRFNPSATIPRKFESCCSADDVESRGVDPEAKEFNGDFYKLCSVDSLRSLDRFSPVKTADAQNKISAQSTTSSPKKLILINSLSKREKQHSVESPSNKNKLSLASPLSKSRPTGLVKPTRPVTLGVGGGIPDVPNCNPSNNLCFRSSTPVCISTQQNAKTAQVPPHNYPSVLQKTSPSSLPVPEKEPKWPNRTEGEVRKILMRCSPAHSKRQYSVARQRMTKEGYGTAWIHLQANPELSDPTARISLLDSMRAPSSSSSDDEEEDVLVIQTSSQLHRICQERRHKVKASAHNPLFEGKKRSSIMGRRELFYRFGDKEREAIACFDFLEEELPTSSAETLSLPNMSPPREQFSVRRTSTPPSGLWLLDRETPSKKERIAFLSPIVSSKSSTPLSSHERVKLPDLWNKPLVQRKSSNLQTGNNCELLDHISLSDSCAESYSSTPDSCYEEAS